MNDELESLIQQLEELKSLRDRLTAVDEAQELDENSADIRVYLKDEIDLIDNEIKELEENTKKKAKEYAEYYDRLKAVIEEEEKALEDTKLLSDEEIYELRDSLENRKLKINEESIEAQRKFEEYEKALRALKKQKTELNNRIKQSEALGLTYNEYKEIYATIKSRNIMNKIYAAKGLDSIVEKKYSERTKEEKELLKQAKEEAMAEIGAFRRKNDDYSILESILAIYILDTKVKKKQEPKVYEMSEESIKNTKANIQEFAHKIKDSSISTQDSKTEEMPKDMESATVNEKVDINTLPPAEEKITLFKDKDDYYVRKYTVDRFKLTSADLGSEVKIDGSICYKISESDVNRIKENADKGPVPYVADVKEVTLEKGLMPLGEKHEEVRPTDIKEKITIFKDGEKYYIRKYVAKRFEPESVERKREYKLNGNICYEVDKDEIDRLVSEYDVVIEECKAEQNFDTPTVNWAKKVKEFCDTYEEWPNIKDAEKKLPDGTTSRLLAAWLMSSGYTKGEFSYTDIVDSNGKPIVEIIDEVSNKYFVNKDADKVKKVRQVEEYCKTYGEWPKVGNEDRRVSDGTAVETLVKWLVVSGYTQGSFQYANIIDETGKSIKDTLDELYTKYGKKKEEQKEITEDEIADAIKEGFTPKEEIKDSDIDSVVEEGFKPKEESIIGEEPIEIEIPNDGIVITFDDEEKEDELEEDNIVSTDEPTTEPAIPEIEISEEEIDDIIEEGISEYRPTNIKASKKFKLELKEGSILYNIVHAAQKFIKKITTTEEIEDMMEEAVEEEDKPRQR